MRIALLSSPTITQNILAATSAYPVELLGSNTIWSKRLSLHDPDVIVVEAHCCLAPIIHRRLFDYLAGHPNIGVVLAGNLTPDLSRLVVSLAGRRTLEVSLTGFDTPRVVWMYLRDAYLPTILPRVMLEIAPALLTFDVDVARAIRLAMQGDEAIKTMPDLAKAAGVNLRTLYRRFDQAGFDAPKDLIRVGRLVKHLPSLYGRSQRLQDVYQDFGYQDYYDFQQLVRRVTGHTPRELRYSVSPAILPKKLVEAALAPSSTPRSSRSRPSPSPRT